MLAKRRGVIFVLIASLLLFSATISYAQKVQKQNEIDKCFNYSKAGDYQRAIEAGKKAVKLYPKDYDAHYCLSNGYLLIGQLELALSYMKKAEKFAFSKKDLMVTYNRFGVIYERIGDLDNAIMYNSKSMSMARESGNAKDIATALNNLAGNYKNKDDTEKALEYYEESLGLRTDEADKATTYNNIAVIYCEKGDYRKAVGYLEKAIDIHSRTGNYRSLAIDILNLGNAYRGMKDYDRGLTKLSEGLAMIQKLGDKYWEAYAYQCIGWLYRDKGDKASAKANYLVAYNMYISIGSKARVADVLYALSTLEKRTPTGTYAGIEIGSKGVKGMVVEITPMDREGFYDLKEIFRHNINTSIISGVAKTGMFSDTAIDETAAAVKKIMDMIVEQANIKKEDIRIVASSALTYVQNAGSLEAKVNRLTGANMDFAFKDGEVLYGILGAVPNKYENSAMLIDVGSGNTKIGYLEDGGSKTVSAELPYGTVSFSEEAKKINPSGANYASTLSGLSANKIKPLLKQEATKKPPILERTPVFMTGGAVWAMATILYPENKESFMHLKADD
ncbi:MAG: tetratricopeptide repeat protein, partial [Pseudomonadota bacterium]|nr:tetratricopeptide repeat protein [Pseudomonadota bacterium]